jgi:hypothetical protein
MKLPQIIRRFLKWRYLYRHEDTGRFITKAEYDRLPESQRARTRLRNQKEI